MRGADVLRFYHIIGEGASPVKRAAIITIHIAAAIYSAGSFALRRLIEHDLRIDTGAYS